MNDAFGMRGIETVGNFNGQIEQRFGVDGTAVDAVLQGLAFKELHDDESLAVFLVDLVDGADVGMVQRRGGAGFALKAVQGLTVFGEFIGEKLKGDETAELDVLGPVYDTHASAAQFLDNAVMRDSLADHRVGQWIRPAPCATILGMKRRQVNGF